MILTSIHGDCVKMSMNVNENPKISWLIMIFPIETGVDNVMDTC